MDAQVVIVTGAAGGIGSAIARRLRSGGWRTVGIDARAAPECDISFELDVSSPEETMTAIAEITSRWGAATGLVTAAGHYESRHFTEVGDEENHRMLQVHLGGFVNAARAVLPGMITAGTGSIVAITSELAIGGGNRDSHYAAAKGAVTGAMRSLAAETAGTGVRVNAIAPGPTDTPLLRGDPQWNDPQSYAQLPTRALATPDEIAECAAFLLDSGGFMTGETLHINSGAVI